MCVCAGVTPHCEALSGGAAGFPALVGPARYTGLRTQLASERLMSGVLVLQVNDLLGVQALEGHLRESQYRKVAAQRSRLGGGGRPGSGRHV